MRGHHGGSQALIQKALVSGVLGLVTLVFALGMNRQMTSSLTSSLTTHLQGVGAR